MYNKFLNKVFSMEYITDISEKQYSATKEKFEQLYNYFMDEYNIPPYITVKQSVENIENANVYTITVYRLGFQSLDFYKEWKNDILHKRQVAENLLSKPEEMQKRDISEKSLKDRINQLTDFINNFDTNLIQLPKNILALYGLPEDSEFYAYKGNDKVCTKIQFSDLDTSPAVIPNIDSNSSAAGSNANNFISKNIQEYINKSNIFKGNADFSKRVNVSNVNKIKDMIKEFFYSVRDKFRVELALNLRNVSTNKYDDYMKDVNNEMYKLVQQKELSQDIDVDELKLLSIDINKLYKYFDTLLNMDEAEDTIFYKLDEYVDTYVESNFDVNKFDIKSYSDLKSKLQIMFKEFLKIAVKGVAEFVNSNTIVAGKIYSKYLKIIARLDDELKLSEEDKNEMSYMLPDAFADIQPEGLALIPNSYIKLLYDTDNVVRKEKMGFNYKVTKKIYDCLSKINKYIYSASSTPSKADLKIIENGVKLDGSNVDSYSDEEVSSAKTNFTTEITERTENKDLKNNILIKSISGYLKELDNVLDYPKSNVSDSIKSELSTLLNISNSPLVTSGLPYILQILQKFINVFKIFKDFDLKKESFQSIVGKLSGLYRSFDPVIANSSIFVENVENLSDLFLSKFDLATADYNIKDNYKKNIETLKEYGIPTETGHAIKLDDKSKKVVEDENEVTNIEETGEETAKESDAEDDKKQGQEDTEVSKDTTIQVKDDVTENNDDIDLNKLTFEEDEVQQFNDDTIVPEESSVSEDEYDAKDSVKKQEDVSTDDIKISENDFSKSIQDALNNLKNI